MLEGPLIFTIKQDIDGVVILRAGFRTKHDDVITAARALGCDFEWLEDELRRQQGTVFVIRDAFHLYPTKG